MENNANYKETDNLERKIEKMKMEGLEYNTNSLNALLNYINRENILPYDINPRVLTEKLRLENLI